MLNDKELTLWEGCTLPQYDFSVTSMAGTGAYSLDFCTTKLCASLTLFRGALR